MSNKSKAGILSIIASILFAFFVMYLYSPPKALPSTSDSSLFSAARAMKHLKVIAKQPHSIGTPENSAVINYLTGELSKLGLTVSIQDTLVSRTYRNGSSRIARVKNIIGQLKGSDNSKAILLMAHHDSQPNTPGAADDGSGVVSILETLRAIKSQGPLKNDVVVLITDGEEIGLMGAKAFVDYHPLLADIGVVLNLEARGNKGVSMSFELNPENGWIARQFAKAAPYPFANSMAYEVYKIMPNDTDFSEFRGTPISGINSACVEGFVNYHSMTDTPENMDLNLLQHHGSNMLGLLQHFGSIKIEETKSSDAIFFNPIGSKLILYPASFSLFFMILTLLLLIATIGLGLVRKQVILQHLFTGIGYFLVILTLSGIGSFLLQQAILALHPHYTLFYANNFYNVAYYFISFIGLSSLFFAIILGFQPELNGLSLSLGGVVMLVLFMFGLSISLPTATYVLYYPLIGYLLVQILLLYYNINSDNLPNAYGIGQFISLIPALGLWTPTIYLLFVTFGLSQAVVAPVIIFCFLGILMIPIIRMITVWKKRILNTLSVLVLLGGVLAGFFSANYSKENPLQTFLMYGYDADNNNAVWATHKPYQNDWVQSLIPKATPRAFNEIYPGTSWKVWRTSAPLANVKSSNILVRKDTINTDNQRIIELNIASKDLINSMEFYIGEGMGVKSIQLDGFDISAKANPRDSVIYFNLFAPPIEGFNLSIITENEQQNMRIIDRKIGLPEQLFPSPLPENMIPGPGSKSNVILVKKSYSF